MEQTLEVQEVEKPMLRSAKDILQPFIISEKVDSAEGSWETYDRFEKAAIYAIIQAQQEALAVMKDLTVGIFNKLNQDND